MTHSRPVGVTLSAIVVILGSAAMVFFSIVMLISSLAVPANPQVPYMAVVSFVMVFFMLLMAGWGIATSIGLFQMRPWSRWSMLVFAGLMTFMSSITVLTTSVMPVPTVPDEVAGIMTGVRIALSLFYGVLALVGIAWLIYFGKRSTRDQFGGAYVPGPGGRPLSISIMGWYLIVSSAFMLVLIALPVPALVLVTVVHGPAAKAVYLVWLAVQLAIGFGLLKLKPWSWKAAIGLCVYGVLGMILSVAVPGLQAEVWEATSAFNTFPESPGVDLKATSRAIQSRSRLGPPSSSLFRSGCCSRTAVCSGSPKPNLPRSDPRSSTSNAPSHQLLRDSFQGASALLPLAYRQGVRSLPPSEGSDRPGARILDTAARACERWSSAGT